MTREFAINILEQYREKPTLVNEIETVEEAVWLDEALDIAIKALEQESCGDLISRQEVGEIKELMTDINGDTVYAVRMSYLRQLPSVNPQPKTGHWITDAKTYYEELNRRGLGVDEYTPYFTDDIACSECLAKYSMLDNETQFFKHCPNCGAKMEDEE